MASATYRLADTYCPYLNINSEACHNFFASPQTPLASSHSSLLVAACDSNDHSTSSHSPNPSNISRKRPRYERTESLACSTGTPCSPAPLANMKYRLAEGLDTPTATTARLSLHNDATPDMSWRRGRSYGGADEQTDYFHNYAGESVNRLPGRDGNGRAPTAAAAPNVAKANTSWGSMVFDLAGRVWDFCTGNFQGFHAGGGQGYSFESPTPVPTPPPPLQRMESSTWTDLASAPTDTDTDTETRLSKRSKISHTSKLRNDWVMVDSPQRNRTRESSPSIGPRRPTIPTSTATSASTRRINPITSRPSLNLRHVSTTHNSRPASSAGLRSPHVISPQALPSHRRSSSFDTRSTTKEGKNRQSNIARPITPNESPGRIEEDQSPIVKQTVKYLDNQRKREAKEDREFKKLNRRLEDMIRQGKEALGTKVEVDEWSDGYEEGDGGGMPGRW